MNGCIGIVDVRSALSKCKMLLPNGADSKPNLVLVEEEFGEVDRFSFLRSCIFADGGIWGEVFSRVPKD